MTTENETETTPTEPRARTLEPTAGGGVDLARGAVYLTAHSVVSGISRLASRYRASRLPHNLADARSAVRHELAAAQEAVAGLPQTLAETRGHRGRRGLYVGAAAGAAVLVGGVALFSALRRSRKREPSVAAQPLPPSVQVEPRP